MIFTMNGKSTIAPVDCSSNKTIYGSIGADLAVIFKDTMEFVDNPVNAAHLVIAAFNLAFEGIVHLQPIEGEDYDL